MKTFARFTAALLLAGALIQAAERFDMLVREDFFAGFAGDSVALKRAMKLCEDTLKENPANAEAMVWHGSGNLFLSGGLFRQGDMAGGGQLWARGLKEMDDAVALAPEKVGVLIPRGATLLIASAQAPPQQGRAMLVKGVNDYEKVRELQKPFFDNLSAHSRGELLFGLADGYRRLDRKPEAQEAFEALSAVGKSSGHQEQAQQWLAGGTYQKTSQGCTGCHSSK